MQQRSADRGVAVEPRDGHGGCEGFCQLDHNTCFPFLALVTDDGSDIIYRVYRNVLDTADVCWLWISWYLRFWLVAPNPRKIPSYVFGSAFVSRDGASVCQDMAASWLKSCEGLIRCLIDCRVMRSVL